VTASIDQLRPAEARPFPRPDRPRFVPLRAGIRNIWEYDNQEFWFAGGRLLLRGQNTAGKSKALELLFPFVLDGDIRSERLDPFGSKAKTMYWNLIEFAERPSAIGYCWAEFGRCDERGVEHYVTVLVGVRAVRSAGKKIDTWFAVTPARAGIDLDLAPGGAPLSAERLRDALPEPSRFTTVAREHRMAVDQTLFGLGPERFGALLHLLLQLRRPKLSEKLDMSRLTDYLTDALPPLDRQRMEALAQAFARLDEDTAEIEKLEASLHEVETFLEHYRAHARVQVRLHADEVRGATTRLDNVTATERQQRAARDEAREMLEGIEATRTNLQLRVEQLRGALDGLDLSKVHALQQVEHRAEQAEQHAHGLRRRAGTDTGAAQRARAEAKRSDDAAREAEAALAELDEAVATAAVATGLGDLHDAHRVQLRDEPERARIALEGAAERRRATLRDLRQAAQRAQAARDRLDRAEREERAAQAELTAAEADRDDQADATERAAETLTEAIDAWVADLDDEVRPAHDYAESVVAQVHQGGQPSPTGLFTAARARLYEARATVVAAIRQVTDERADLDDQRARIEAEVDDAPPPAPGRPANRPEGCAPLWACVDFAPGLPADQRAGLEAALEAAGLLDALVTPAGDVLDSATLDTWLVPGTVPIPWLVPALDGPLDAASVQTALSALGGVAPDGSWSGRGLAGRWSKPEAEYIGAAARAAARHRRITALTERIAALDERLDDLEAESQALAAREGRLAQDEQAFPSTSPLRDALRDLERATHAVAERRQRAEAAATRRAEEGQRAARVLAELTAAEETAGCRAIDLDDAFDALGDYRHQLVALVSAAATARREGDRAAQDRERADQLVATAHATDAEATRAEHAAAGARSEADELRRTSAADVEAVLARQRELADQRDAAIAELDDLAQARDQARDRLVQAETRLETTEDDRREAESRRAAALAGLARVAGTELAVLAMGTIDTDRDLTQVTAGLNFARAAYERLRDTDVDQRARDGVSNRLHRSFSTLQSQLGAAFDPYLDTTDGIEVCFATLNGKPIGIGELAGNLAEQVRRRRETLTDEERQLIERHLLTEVGTHLGERVHAAWSLVTRMNQQLADHPTRGGVTLRLAWEPVPDASREALGLLKRDVNLLDHDERATLATFLQDRVRIARDDAEGADVVERLAAALDYRRWHRFVISRSSHGREERLTARTQGVGSGGEQAKLAHLPLFAATAAYYSSAASTAPHLLMLDEAFAGIDDQQRADCMHMLVDLDLDVVLTNFAEFGCYPEVPALAIYHLERTPGQLGVTALRFVWDGSARREDDPFLDSLEASLGAAPEDGLFA
jgi:uncharacterized protein (TIGR02680 family)